MVCKNCGHIAVPRGYKKLRGNYLVSTILWTFIVPGIFYSIWRRMGCAGSCEKCGGNSFASLDSKYGRSKMEEFYMEQMVQDITKNKH